MGREIKRVSDELTSWPLGKIWKGYLNPYSEGRQDCVCGGDGRSKAARAVVRSVSGLQGNFYGLVEAKLAEMGIEGEDALCATCKGEGCLWHSEELKLVYENFYDTRDTSIGAVWTEPPSGEWWQVWETVSEGSPVTPAFETANELVEYLVANGDLWDQRRRAEGSSMYCQPPSRKAAESFVFSGWAPSMVIGSDGVMTSGINIAGEDGFGPSE